MTTERSDEFMCAARDNVENVGRCTGTVEKRLYLWNEPMSPAMRRVMRAVASQEDHVGPHTRFHVALCDEHDAWMRDPTNDFPADPPDVAGYVS